MDKMIAGLLILTGIVHLLPVSGVLGADRLQSLYGVAIGEPNLLILMRHRALLFASIGLLLIAAAVIRDWQVPAIAAALVSVSGFLALASMSDGANALVRRVLLVDWCALAFLLTAVGLKLFAAFRTAP